MELRTLVDCDIYDLWLEVAFVAFVKIEIDQHNNSYIIALFNFIYGCLQITIHYINNTIDHLWKISGTKPKCNVD